MAKNEDDARGRLQRAAVELFQDRGYDRTTAAEIAARAGVTERTFFRHFRDKREVLFDGEAILKAALTGAVADAPAALGALPTLFLAFGSVLPALEANRSFAKPRHEIIANTPALHERELAKTAVLADALAASLQARGVDKLRSLLAARVGMAAFVQTIVGWLDNPEPGLAERLDAAARELRLILAEGEG